jgi:RNA polymerase sigma factor (sigma-70 family)
MAEHAAVLIPQLAARLDDGHPSVDEAGVSVAPTLVSVPRFEDFFRAEYPSLLRALFLVTGNRHEAEELAQETFVRAYERWGMVSRADNRAGYVYRMAINLYRSKLRRVARAARRTVKPPPEPDPIGALDDRDAIGRALGKLSERQREAVVMVEWLGLSHEDAGRALGISPITVRVRIHRARAVLRPLLCGEGE